MLVLISTLTLLPAVTATIYGTCTPSPTQAPNFDAITYPTTLTEVYSCTQNLSWVPVPFVYWTAFSNHEQTLTTLQPFPSRPTSFPYTHVVTVQGVLSRTEWVGVAEVVTQTFLSTVTDVDTVVLETRKTEATSA